MIGAAVPSAVSGPSWASCGAYWPLIRFRVIVP